MNGYAPHTWTDSSQGLEYNPYAGYQADDQFHQEQQQQRQLDPSTAAGYYGQQDAYRPEQPYNRPDYWQSYYDCPPPDAASRPYTPSQPLVEARDRGQVQQQDPYAQASAASAAWYATEDRPPANNPPWQSPPPQPAAYAPPQYPDYPRLPLPLPGPSTEPSYGNPYSLDNRPRYSGWSPSFPASSDPQRSPPAHSFLARFAPHPASTRPSSTSSAQAHISAASLPNHFDDNTVQHHPIRNERFLSPASLQSHQGDYDERPAGTWEGFQIEWQRLLKESETELKTRAVYGYVNDYTPPVMASAPPTFESCDDLVAGLLRYNNRITVDKLKTAIRGFNMVPSLPLSSVKVSGNKQDLVNRIVDVLRSLRNSRSPAYFPVARIVGELQGLQYPPENGAAPAPPAPANNAAAAMPNYAGYASNYGSSSPYPYDYGSTPVPSSSATAGPSNYASRSSQFGLNRSPAPGRAQEQSTSHYNPVTNNYGAPQPNGRYSNSPASQYRPAPPPASTATVLPPKPAASTSTLNTQLPTSWPRPLPPVAKSAVPGQPAIPINFKPSPFFKIISAVSPVVNLPRPHAGDRASSIAHLTLTDEIRTKLQAARDNPKAPQYQLRLYCASADFYQPNASLFGTAARQAVPIEFPLSSEAKMNDSAVIANLRGIKKKPGTAPPAHVSSAKVGNPSKTSSATPLSGPIGSYALKLGPGNPSNKVELVYMNTEKTYYMIVYFVESFSVEQVVEKVKADRFRKKEDVLKSIHQAAEDPEIQATASTVSMKDPLTYTSLNTPVRSIHCPHLQCFDAFCFYSMMESTPDWKCPICNRTISSDELVHDGFFQDLKDTVPSSIDSVIVEVDGTWRTEDNKYGNAKKAVDYREAVANGTHVALSVNVSRAGSTSSLGKDGTPVDTKPALNGLLGVPAGGAANGRGTSKSKTPAPVIELFDDDEDDYGANADTPPPPGALAKSSGGAASAASGRPVASGTVIDLTLSDESDDEASSSVVGLGSRAPSTVTPNTSTSGGAPSTVAGGGGGANGNVAAGVKRRLDSEAAYEELYGSEDAADGNERPSQIARYE